MLNWVGDVTIEVPRQLDYQRMASIDANSEEQIRWHSEMVVNPSAPRACGCEQWQRASDEGRRRKSGGRSLEVYGHGRWG